MYACACEFRGAAWNLWYTMCSNCCRSCQEVLSDWWLSQRENKVSCYCQKDFSMFHPGRSNHTHPWNNIHFYLTGSSYEKHWYVNIHKAARSSGEFGLNLRMGDLTASEIRLNLNCTVIYVKFFTRLWSDTFTCYFDVILNYPFNARCVFCEVKPCCHQIIYFQLFTCTFIWVK